MIDARVPLQAAIVAAAKAANVTGQRIFDRVPTSPEPAFPYTEIKGMDAVDASDSCHDGVEVFVDLAVHSRAVGSVESKAQAARLALALDAALTVTGFEVLIHEVVRTRSVKEPDGLTTRDDVSLRYVLAPST